MTRDDGHVPITKKALLTGKHARTAYLHEELALIQRFTVFSRV